MPFHPVFMVLDWKKTNCHIPYKLTTHAHKPVQSVWTSREPMEDQSMEAAILHFKGRHPQGTLSPKKGPRGYTTKQNRKTEIIAIQKNILTLNNTIQTAPSHLPSISKSPKFSPSSPSSKRPIPGYDYIVGVCDGVGDGLYSDVTIGLVCAVILPIPAGHL